MLTTDQIIELVVAGVTALLLLILGLVFISGRGAFLIAGFNTIPRKEKEKYDVKALGRFVGRMFCVVAALLVLCQIDRIFQLVWLASAGGILIVLTVIFALIYANTRNRFRV